MSHPAIHFYDASVSPNVPSGVYAAVPADGAFKWQQSEIERMGRVFMYTVLGGKEAAHYARGIDIETGDRANLSQYYIPFLVERTKHYGDATPYCNRSTLPLVKAQCERVGILDKMHFWVATLDGTMDFPGAWAVQYHGGMHAPFDLSVLHGVNNFVNP